MSDVLTKLLNEAVCIYRYGSFVYNTYQEGVSDEDFIVIIPNKFEDREDAQFERDNKQYTFHTITEWQARLDANAVDAIECYFLPAQFIIKNNYQFTTIIKPELIRAQFSRTASNSWVKCKKKLTVEKDFAPKIGKKSLWHSLRILGFGIQSLQHGQIKDYSSANYLYQEIVNCPSDDWDFFKAKYQKIYNELKTEFRLAEKSCGLFIINKNNT